MAQVPQWTAPSMLQAPQIGPGAAFLDASFFASREGPRSTIKDSNKAHRNKMSAFRSDLSHSSAGDEVKSRSSHSASATTCDKIVDVSTGGFSSIPAPTYDNILNGGAQDANDDHELVMSVDDDEPAPYSVHAYFEGLFRSLEAQVHLASHFLMAHEDAVAQRGYDGKELPSGGGTRVCRVEAETAVLELTSSVASFGTRVRSWSGAAVPRQESRDLIERVAGTAVPFGSNGSEALGPKGTVGAVLMQGSPASLNLDFKSPVGSLVKAQDINNGHTEQIQVEAFQPQLWPSWAEDAVDGASCTAGVSSKAAEALLRDRPMLIGITAGVSSRATTKAPRRARVVNTSEGKWAHFPVASPNSCPQTVRDVLSTLAIFYDLLTLPLMFFDFHGGVFTLMTSIFWGCDILATFCMGYVDHEGAVEMRPEVIAAKYLHGWLLPDVLVVAIDLAMIMFDSIFASKVASVVRVSKLVRAARLMRMVRLFRAVRISKYFATYTDSVMSDTFMASFGVIKLLGVIALICHFVGCFWYGIGNFEEDFGAHGTWLDQLRVTTDDVKYRYMVCFHWAFAQFTPAPISYHAVTFWEEAFTLFVLFFGFVVFSSFIGSVSGKVTTIRMNSEQRENELMLMTHFVRANGVSWRLANKILTIARQRSHAAKPTQRRVVESDVNLLKHAPETLTRELRSEVYGPTLEEHKLFCKLFEVHPRTMSDLCFHALEQEVVPKEGEVFPFGEEASTMIFVLCYPAGYLRYIPGLGVYESKDEHADDTVCFEGGGWLNEAALWIRFKHFGRLISGAQTAIAKLDSKIFQRVVNNHANAKKDIAFYAQRFALHAVKQGLFRPMGGRSTSGFSVASNLDTWPRPGDALEDEFDALIAASAAAPQ